MHKKDKLLAVLEKVWTAMEDGSINDCGFDSEFIRLAIKEAKKGINNG